ncbi:MAG TPA: hypothetical protein DCQ33_11845 [Nitrospira sp.]|nr:hypothetical protein [Nitrospira sp.]
MLGWPQVGRFAGPVLEVAMSALLPLKRKSSHGQDTTPPAALGSASAGIYIPPPIPTEKATLEQIRASLEISLAQVEAGLGEDFDVVQARMRAKYGLRSR